MSKDECVLETLVGSVISSVTGLSEESLEVVFTLSDGRTFKMYHEQDCCESVEVHDVCGDIEDLIGAIIVHFEERVSESQNGNEGTCTWTFYDIQTTKGCVNIRWLGESNGYYSEAVDVRWIHDAQV